MIVGGTHPYAASMAVFCHLFANGMLAWLDLLEKLAGPLPFITRERLLTNDVDALRASLAHDRPDLSGGLAGGRLPQLFAGAADPDYPRIQQVARELTTRFVALDGLNHLPGLSRERPGGGDHAEPGRCRHRGAHTTTEDC